MPRVDSTPNINNYRSITSLNGSTQLKKTNSTTNLPTENGIDDADAKSEVTRNHYIA